MNKELMNKAANQNVAVGAGASGDVGGRLKAAVKMVVRSQKTSYVLDRSH